MQSKLADVNFVHERIKKFSDFLETIRSDDRYHDLKAKVFEMLPHHKTEKRIASELCPLMFKIIDTISEGMEARFRDHKDFEFLSLLDMNFFSSYQWDFPHHLLRSLKSAYEDFFDISRLQNELKFIYHDDDFKKPLKDLLKFIFSEDLQKSLPEVVKLLKLCLTIPISSASTERSFSVLKRIKTYQRNTIGQERLTSLARISIEREFLESLPKSELFDLTIEKFARLKPHRIDFLYK